ncbi:hypothetical protein HYALB_00005685 [Hymenoscyphus albidus]|uniref:Transmembrane protein n=1 Tax=Hymenoscyphus albidus TaxID=595503 RepID=A0A9N9LLL6_9HELO|nr:hypothetical protein HYALB_00005685 [Hymenoscyphus albidus]
MGKMGDGKFPSQHLVARQVQPQASVTSFGATRTTTITTTVSVNGPGGTSLFYPWPAITGSSEVTTVTDLEGPRTEAVLVTDIVGVILGTDGRVLTSATLNHQDPQNTGIVTGESGRCVEFKCWSSATQAGVIFLAVFLGLVVLGVIIWCLLKGRKPRKGGEGKVGTRKKGPLGMDGTERGQFIVEDVERGEGRGRRRRRRRKHRARSPSPDQFTASDSVEVVKPRSRSHHRTSGHYTRHSRDGRPREEVDPRLPPGTYVNRETVESYRLRSGNYTATTRSLSVSPRPARVASTRSRPATAAMPNHTDIGYAASTPRSMSKSTRTVRPTSASPLITPSRDPFYAPRVRDFGAPSPRLEGREVTRPRERSPYPPERRERRASPNEDNIITVEVEEENPPPQRRRQRRRRSTGEEYDAREDRDRRRRERTDAEDRHRSLSHSGRKQEHEKPKRSTFRKNAKWLALLPLALRAINILAEPDGGWNQYHKGKGKGKNKNRVNKVPTQGIGPDLYDDNFEQEEQRRDPSLERRARRWNTTSGRYPESHNRRSSSADSARLHAYLAIESRAQRHRS